VRIYTSWERHTRDAESSESRGALLWKGWRSRWAIAHSWRFSSDTSGSCDRYKCMYLMRVAVCSLGRLSRQVLRVGTSGPRCRRYHEGIVA
jgi:hypothetical protein